MSCVAFLPKEFGGAKKHARAHFPADYVGPLVELQWKITPRLDPARHCITNNGLGCRANHQWLFELCLGVGNEPTFSISDQTVVSYNRHFLGKAIDVVCLTFKIGKRDEEREIGVVDTGFFDPVVHQALNALPNAITPRLDHHAAAHARLFSEVGSANDFLIPFGEIVFALHIERVANVGHFCASCFCSL